MKKRGILFGTIGLLAILICGCNKTQAEKVAFRLIYILIYYS